MLKSFFRKSVRLFYKDILEEWRRPWDLMVSFLFGATIITSLAISVGPQFGNPEFVTAVFWTIVYLASFIAVARSFDKEYERNTIYLLFMSMEYDELFFGKLLYNLTVLYALITLLYPITLFFFQEFIDFWFFIILALLVPLGITPILTLIAALTVHARHKTAILPIVAIPILLPLQIVTFKLSLTLDFSSKWDMIILLVFYDLVAIFSSVSLYSFIFAEK